MIAALSAWHERHEAAAEAAAGVTALPAHVLVEAYAVLTRLPGGLAVPPATAAAALARRFADPPLCLDDTTRRRLLERLAAGRARPGPVRVDRPLPRRPWFADYDTDLGAPAGAMTTDASGVRRRTFARGLVLVNPTAAAQRADLGGSYSGDGLRRVTAAWLAAHSALILTA